MLPSLGGYRRHLLTASNFRVIVAGPFRAWRCERIHEGNSGVWDSHRIHLSATRIMEPAYLPRGQLSPMQPPRIPNRFQSQGDALCNVLNRSPSPGANL
jgi:hypothetical protein